MINSTSFAEQIEGIVWELDVSYMDAVLLYCDRTGMEPEAAGEVIAQDPVLRQRLRTDAEKLHFIEPEGGAKLPF